MFYIKSVFRDVRKLYFQSCTEKKRTLPATTAIEYYRREVRVPFIDHLIGELNNRFFNGQENVVPKASTGCLIPAQVIAKDNWRIMAREFMREYEAGMPAPLSFRAEMDLCETH